MTSDGILGLNKPEAAPRDLFGPLRSADSGYGDRLLWSARLSTGVHLLAIIVFTFGSWWPWWATPPAPNAKAPAFEVTFLRAPEEAGDSGVGVDEPRDERVWARRPAEPARDDERRLEPPAADIDIAGYTVNLEKFMPGTEMFPFITTDLGLQTTPPTREGGIDRWPFGIGTTVEAASGLPPLLVSDNDAQAIVDQLWSRRSRWDDFGVFTDLVSSYHPNEGRLPELLQAIVAQNILQPYAAVGAPDPQLWVMLEIAAEHGEFIAFATRYINEHPSTRVATELLFLLDELAQGSRSALTHLLETDMDTGLYWTRSFQPGAFALLDRIRRRIEAALDASGLGTLDDVEAAYDLVRLDLLSRIVETSPNGYRVNDAHYLMGAIYWSHERRDEAAEAWRWMRPDPVDSYFTASTDVLAARGAPEAIDAALEAEHRRWIDFSVDRLQQFGFRFETF